MKKKGVGQNKNFGKLGKKIKRLPLPESLGEYFGGLVGSNSIDNGVAYFYLGPIQKLTVPDFTHIANVFEQM